MNFKNENITATKGEFKAQTSEQMRSHIIELWVTDNLNEKEDFLFMLTQLQDKAFCEGQNNMEDLILKSIKDLKK